MRKKTMMACAVLLAMAGRAWSLEPTLEGMKQDSGLRFMENSGRASAETSIVSAGDGGGHRGALSQLLNGRTPAVLLDRKPVPVPPADKADLYRRYERKGESIGLLAGAAAGAALGAVAGAPSIVGAVAAAMLLGYFGGRAGVIVGRYAGRAAAGASIALGQFAQEAKVFIGNVKVWWDMRPHWGQPYP